MLNRSLQRLLRAWHPRTQSRARAATAAAPTPTASADAMPAVNADAVPKHALRSCRSCAKFGQRCSPSADRPCAAKCPTGSPAKPAAAASAAIKLLSLRRILLLGMACTPANSVLRSAAAAPASSQRPPAAGLRMPCRPSLPCPAAVSGSEIQRAQGQAWTQSAGRAGEHGLRARSRVTPALLPPTAGSQTLVCLADCARSPRQAGWGGRA